jgi:hypothetical protein
MIKSLKLKCKFSFIIIKLGTIVFFKCTIVTSSYFSTLVFLLRVLYFLLPPSIYFLKNIATRVMWLYHLLFFSRLQYSVFLYLLPLLPTFFWVVKALSLIDVSYWEKTKNYNKKVILCYFTFFFYIYYRIC